MPNYFSWTRKDYCKCHQIIHQTIFFERTLEPVWVCSIDCVFFKTQLQFFSYKKIWYIIYWVPSFFCIENAVFTKQELLFFCTVQWTMQLTWTVQNDALFVNSARNYTVHVKNSEQCNSLALFTCTALIYLFILSVLSFFLLIFFKKTSLAWILYMIIFYLILLHAKKLWKL